MDSISPSQSTEGEQEGGEGGEDTDREGPCENKTMDIKGWMRKAQSKEWKRRKKG